jgi:hypothetical protein
MADSDKYNARKDSRKTVLHKLHVIHILEADYNLALKRIFGSRLMKNSE